MEENRTINKKQPFYKKIMGVAILVAAAMYCIPELREKVMSYIEFMKNEWRKMK